MVKINVKAGSKTITVNATSDKSNYYSELSKKWAVAESLVEGLDYSSKYYANESKNSAAGALQSLQSVETAKVDAINELQRDAAIYIEEAKIQADNADASAALAKTTVNVGIAAIDEIIGSAPEKFAGFGLFDTKLTDHILTGQDATGWALQGSLVTMTYADAVDKVKELYENGEEIKYRGVSCKRAADGRYVADITQKELIDALFADTGVADFYVLDSENSQFYLPRSNWFNQMTVDTGLVNTFNEAGLPSGNLYYKIGNTVINETQIDVGNVLSDLQTKADLNLTNTEPSQSFKEMSVDWCMPDYASGVSFGSGFVAPSAGWIFGYTRANSGSDSSSLYVNGLMSGKSQGGNTIQDPVSLYALVAKGDTVTLVRMSVTFYPMKGVTNA